MIRRIASAVGMVRRHEHVGKLAVVAGGASHPQGRPVVDNGARRDGRDGDLHGRAAIVVPRRRPVAFQQTAVEEQRSGMVDAAQVVPTPVDDVPARGDGRSAFRPGRAGTQHGRRVAEYLLHGINGQARQGCGDRAPVEHAPARGTVGPGYGLHHAKRRERIKLGAAQSLRRVQAEEVVRRHPVRQVGRQLALGIDPIKVRQDLRHKAFGYADQVMGHRNAPGVGWQKL